jgi:hypothetical protein
MRTVRFLFNVHWLLAIVIVTGCSGTQFVRQESFPTGETIILVYFYAPYRTASSYDQYLYGRRLQWFDHRLKSISSRNLVLNAAKEKSWIASKQVAAEFAKTSAHPITAIDSNNLEIINTSGEDKIHYSIFYDQFAISIDSLSRSKTKVTVERSIFEAPGFVPKECVVRSSGEMENWILTRIQDEAKKE